MIPALWLFLTWFIATGISVWAIEYVSTHYEPWAHNSNNGWRVIGRDFRHAARVVQRSGGSVTEVGWWPVYIMIGFLLGIAHTLWLYA